MKQLAPVRTLLILSLVLLLAGYGTGRYLQPAKVEIQKEEVVKEVEVIKRDVVVRERIVRQKDGTEVTERTTEDKSTESSKKEKETKEESTVTNKKPDWRVNALGALVPGLVPSYGVQVERRVLGPIHVGAFGLTNSTFGISVGIEF